MYRLIIFLVLSVFLCSCDNGHKEEIHHISVNGVVVSDDIFLGRPNAMLLYDSLILISDRYEDKMLTVVNKNTFSSVGRFINIGNGPGEVANRVEWSIFEDRLYAYQSNKGGILNIYSLPDFAYIESVQIANYPAAVQRMPNYYVGNGIVGEGRLQIFDDRGKFLFTGGDYPDNAHNVSDDFRFVAYQGWYCTHPRENRYVFGESYSDHIEFHTILDDKHVLVSENKGSKVVMDFETNGNAKFVDNTFLGYKGAYGGEKYCYMLFMDKTLKENKGRRSLASDNVYQYSWDGELMVVYKLDRPVVGIMTDEEDGYLYGISQDEEGYQHIVKFKL